MKKSIAIILSVLMLFSMLPIASAEADTLEERTYPCYIGSLDNSVEATLAFLNGVDDLPYIDMETWGSILYVVCAYALGNEDFDLSYEMDGSTLVLTRENGYDIVHSHLNSLSGFPLFAAKDKEVVFTSKSGTKVAKVDYYTNTIRISGTDKEEIMDLGEKIYPPEVFRQFSAAKSQT